jgi:drug/metabolite transporter (DMT)-like permease
MADPLDDQTPNDVSALLGNVPVTVVTASAGEIASAIARGFVTATPKTAPTTVVERVAPRERAFRPLLLVAAAMAARLGGIATLRTRRPGGHALRSLFNLATMLTFYYALDALPHRSIAIGYAPRCS